MCKNMHDLSVFTKCKLCYVVHNNVVIFSIFQIKFTFIFQEKSYRIHFIKIVLW